MCAAAVSVRPPVYHPRPSTSLARVDIIRQHFDQQRQDWDQHIQAKCSQLMTHRHQQPREHPASPPPETQAEQTSPGPALRLVSSDHAVSATGVTWTVTYDIRDFLQSGSVEVHCDPDGIVVTASLNSDLSQQSGSLKRRRSPNHKVFRETFLIANVDHSSLRVKSQPNGLMQITVSNRTLSRQLSKRTRAS